MTEIYGCFRFIRQTFVSMSQLEQRNLPFSIFQISISKYWETIQIQSKSFHGTVFDVKELLIKGTCLQCRLEQACKGWYKKSASLPMSQGINRALSHSDPDKDSCKKTSRQLSRSVSIKGLKQKWQITARQKALNVDSIKQSENCRQDYLVQKNMWREQFNDFTIGRQN